MEQQTFINLIKDKAIELQTTYKILPSITVSQAILESRYGNSSLAQNTNNIFGIKYSEGCGYDKYLISTKEIENGQEVTVQAYFRKYNSVEESIKDHAIFLQKERYKNIIGDTDYKSVANKLYEDGYSTSPEYPSKLIKLIEKYGLNNYDSLKTYYRVQCGAYKNKDLANKIIKKLTSDGVKSCLIYENHLYKIQVGSYTIKTNADEQASKVSALGYEVYIATIVNHTLS